MNQTILGRWNRSCHKWPCRETDRIDDVLNALEACSIRLTAEEMKLCDQFTRSQRDSSKGFRSLKCSDRSDFQINKEGTLAEMAVENYFGFPHRNSNFTFREADLPCNIEVRSTSYTNGTLKVRPDDADDRRMVLAIVSGFDRPVRLAGWMTAREGKMFRLFDPGNKKAHFHAVPQDALNPMDELKEIVLAEHFTCPPSDSRLHSKSVPAQAGHPKGQYPQGVDTVPPSGTAVVTATPPQVLSGAKVGQTH